MTYHLEIFINDNMFRNKNCSKFSSTPWRLKQDLKQELKLNLNTVLSLAFENYKLIIQSCNKTSGRSFILAQKQSHTDCSYLGQKKTNQYYILTSKFSSIIATLNSNTLKPLNQHNCKTSQLTKALIIYKRRATKRFINSFLYFKTSLFLRLF